VIAGVLIWRARRSRAGCALVHAITVPEQIEHLRRHANG
jgi:hypothetical protein